MSAALLLNDLPRLTDEERDSLNNHHAVIPAAMDNEQVSRRDESDLIEIDAQSAYDYCPDCDERASECICDFADQRSRFRSSDDEAAFHVGSRAHGEI